LAQNLTKNFAGLNESWQHTGLNVAPTQDTMKDDSAMKYPVTRRKFLESGAIVTVGLTAPSFTTRAQVNKNSRLRIFQIGAGGVGGMQRSGLKGHLMVELLILIEFP
jgi:hypothetical protein